MRNNARMIIRWLVVVLATCGACTWAQQPSAEPDLPISGPKNLPPINRKTDEKLVHRPAFTTRPAGSAKTDEKELERPGPHNTGVRDQKNLKRSGKIEAADGQVIENLFIAGSIKANDTKNVIIRNCVIDGMGAHYGIQSRGAVDLVIENCEIYNVASAAIYGDGFTARGNNISQSKGDGIKPGANCVIEGNYIHTLGFGTTGAHADGVQIRGGKNIRIIGNYFDMPRNRPDTHSNAGVFIQGMKGKRGTRDILVERNWFRGGNFTIHAYSDGDDPTTIKILNNRFYQGEAQYGCGKIQPGVEWSGNVFEVSGAAAGPQSK
jgi:hypothetical protein